MIKYEVKLRPIKQRGNVFGGRQVSLESFWLVMLLALTQRCDAFDDGDSRHFCLSSPEVPSTHALY